MGSSKKRQGGKGRLQCLNGSTRHRVCLFGTEGRKAGGGLEVRRDTGEQMRDEEELLEISEIFLGLLPWLNYGFLNGLNN